MPLENWALVCYCDKNVEVPGALQRELKLQRCHFLFITAIFVLIAEGRCRLIGWEGLIVERGKRAIFIAALDVNSQGL